MMDDLKTFELPDAVCGGQAVDAEACAGVRKRGRPLETIASALGISRGTVDNELRRAGEAIDRHTADFSRDEILEKILDVLS